MKKILSFLLIPLALFSCEKYPFEGNETLETMNFEATGNNQTAQAGTYLADSVGIYIYSQQFKYGFDKVFYTRAEILEGEGSVDEETIFANAEGKMFTRWKLGTNPGNNILKLTISDTKGTYSSSLQIEASSYIFGEWNTFLSGVLNNVTDMVTDTVNYRSIMISNNKLRKITDNSFQARTLNTINTIFHSVEKDELGNIYVGSYDGRMYKILDWESWWQPIGRPIPNYSGEYELTVTPDNFVWASCEAKGLYFSKDGGQSWQKATSGIIANEKLGRIFRLSDGSYITFSETRDTLLQSIDGGLNWVPFNTPENSRLCYVAENSEILTVAEENGFSIYRSTDLGQNYSKVYSGTTTNLNFSPAHTFAKYRDFYYILIPGAEILKTTDFTQFEKLRSTDIQKYLNIDHRGTFFVCGEYGQTAYILSSKTE